MADSREKIIRDIRNYIRRHGGGPKGWYVGISSDPRTRLSSGHGVREKGDAWIYRTANSSQVAREIEGYFVTVFGTDGGLGGGDLSTNKVYAYKKARHTDP